MGEVGLVYILLMTMNQKKKLKKKSKKKLKKKLNYLDSINYILIFDQKLKV